jgi:hypothetical protein
MNILAIPRERLAVMKHHGVEIVELNFGGRKLADSVSLIREYAFYLEALPKGAKALALIDFQDALYDPLLTLAWKSNLELFSRRVDKSAIIGALAMTPVAVKGYAQTAALLNYPLGPNRCVVFKTRDAALDFLSAR